MGGVRAAPGLGSVVSALAWAGRSVVHGVDSDRAAFVHAWLAQHISDSSGQFWLGSVSHHSFQCPFCEPRLSAVVC